MSVNRVGGFQRFGALIEYSFVYVFNCTYLVYKYVYILNEEIFYGSSMGRVMGFGIFEIFLNIKIGKCAIIPRTKLVSQFLRHSFEIFPTSFPPQEANHLSEPQISDPYNI